MELTSAEQIIFDYIKIRDLDDDLHVRLGQSHAYGRMDYVLNALKDVLELSPASLRMMAKMSLEGKLWSDILSELSKFTEENILASRIKLASCILASKPSKEQENWIHSRLKEIFPDDIVVLNMEIDSNIMGGCQIEVAGKMFDYSYRNKFNLLREKIIDLLEGKQ